MACLVLVILKGTGRNKSTVPEIKNGIKICRIHFNTVLYDTLAFLKLCLVVLETLWEGDRPSEFARLYYDYLRSDASIYRLAIDYGPRLIVNYTLTCPFFFPPFFLSLLFFLTMIFFFTSILFRVSTAIFHTTKFNTCQKVVVIKGYQFCKYIYNMCFSGSLTFFLCVSDDNTTVRNLLFNNVNKTVFLTVVLPLKIINNFEIDPRGES